MASLNTQQGYHIYLIAGEASGDFIASQLMKALRVQVGTSLRVSGVGGPLMASQGLESLFPMGDISLMGLTEVIPKIPLCLRRIRQTVQDIQSQKPDVVITVDAPDFCHRVTKALKKSGSSIPCVHYVAPTVWAWRAGRAARIAKHLDLLLTLFPFEPPYFEKHGLQTLCVGHPLVEVDLPSAFQADDPLSLCVLPGSRLSEITRLLPLFRDVSLKLKEHFPSLTLQLPTLPHLRSAVDSILGSSKAYFHITETVDAKWLALQSATAALAASGTVSLELAKTQTPHLIAYRVSPLTYGLGRLLIKTPYVGLVNILLGHPVVPELLQGACNLENLYKHLVDLLESGHTQKPYLARAYGMLEGPEGLAPSEAAAKAILGMMERSR